MNRWAPLLVASALLAGGCGEPVLDAEDLDASIAAVRDSVDAAERPAFDAAIDLVRRASTGEVTGTAAFSLDGMSAAAVLAEAQRIEIRRERELETEAAAAQREVLEAEDRLALLRVLDFTARPVGASAMQADLTVRNDLEFPVATAWLRVEVAIPDGASSAGEEFVTFRPPLEPGAERTQRIEIFGEEARSLPVEPPARLHCRFVIVDRGAQEALRAPSPDEREKAEAALAESERRIAELDARLAAVPRPE